MRTFGLIFLFFSSLALVIAHAEGPLTDPTRFGAGVTGSMPGSESWNHITMFEYTAAQDLLLAISEKPRSKDFIDQALEGLPFGLDEIMAQRLLREEDGLFYLNFNFLTQKDQKLIFDVSEKYGASLTAEYQKEWPAFRRIFQARTQEQISEPYLAYEILGLMSLDWDGLDVTHRLGMRQLATHAEGDYKFTPWVKEEGDLVSLRELFWGSHNDDTISKNFVFTSFGDHDALPRRGIPDIYWNTKISLKNAEGNLKNLNAQTGTFALANLYRTYGELLFAMRDNPLTLEEITAQIGWSVEEAQTNLDYLIELQFLSKTGDGYLAAIPVLTSADRDMVLKARKLSEEVMESWLKKNYAKIKKDLSGLPAVSQGVPFEVMFTEIWHFIFGLTNRDLVAAGLFADPYGDDRTYKGFLPVLWANEVYGDFDLQ